MNKVMNLQEYFEAMTIDDFIEELDIAIEQDGHDIYFKADSAKAIKDLIISGDTISRQAAIDAAIEATDDWDGGHNITRANMIEKELNDLPSAQPERKVGKWIDHSDDGYVECPFCGSATNCDDNINELHYCFSCGAKMEEQE